jgi:hypothetical protein
VSPYPPSSLPLGENSIPHRAAVAVAVPLAPHSISLPPAGQKSAELHQDESSVHAAVSVTGLSIPVILLAKTKTLMRICLSTTNLALSATVFACSTNGRKDGCCLHPQHRRIHNLNPPHRYQSVFPFTYDPSVQRRTPSLPAEPSINLSSDHGAPPSMLPKLRARFPIHPISSVIRQTLTPPPQMRGRTQTDACFPLEITRK